MQAIGNRQFETPAKAEDQSRIRRMADRGGSIWFYLRLRMKLVTRLR